MSADASTPPTGRFPTRSGPGVFTRALPRFFLLWLAGFALATGIFRQNVLLRTHTFFASFDSSVQSYAWNAANAQAVRDGTVKLWDFTTSSGTSFAGEMQTAPFYPANWVFAWFAAPTSVELQEWRLLAHFGLLFAGACALLRHNKHSRIASVTGAILTSFMGSFALRAGAQPNIFESLCHLPLVVWLSQRAMESAARPWKCARCWQAGAACGCMVLAGHMQPPLHAGLAVALLCFFLPPFTFGGFRSRTGRLLMVAGVALLVALPQIAATGEYMALSYRWIGADKPTPPPHHVPYAIYAFSYVLGWSDWRLLFDSQRHAAEGATLFVGFSGLALAILGFLRLGRIGLYGLGLATLAVLIALGDNSTVGKLSYYVPGLNAIRTPVRTLCLYHVGVGILAAAGVDVLLLALRRLPLRLALSLATVPALVLTVEAGANASRHLQTRSDPLYPLVYYSDPWMLEKSRLTLAEPGAAYRLMALPNEATPPNLGNVNGSLSIRGHRATMQMRYFKYLRRDWSPAGESFRHLGLRYVFSREPLPQPMILLDSRNGLSFYERPDALSVFQVVEVDSVRSARLESINWAHNDVRLILAKGESGRVVFAQARYPGWTAKLDGETVPIVKEDAFISVNVPPGARELVFAYRPWWLVPGIALALGALVVAVITATRASFSTSHPSSGP